MNTLEFLIDRVPNKLRCRVFRLPHDFWKIVIFSWTIFHRSIWTWNNIFVQFEGESPGAPDTTYFQYIWGSLIQRKWPKNCLRFYSIFLDYTSSLEIISTQNLMKRFDVGKLFSVIRTWTSRERIVNASELLNVPGTLQRKKSIPFDFQFNNFD